ncbi:MAG: hypothetical protein H0T46_20975 [Deltaproteobacteria bacterium]|nr:hypothetical protein [Deltaproteobacteria bacterium]
MRSILLLSLLFTAACVEHDDDDDDDHDRDHHDDDDDDRQSCSTDSDCGRGDLCGPPGVCLAPDEVRSVEIAWTIAGKPAGESTCAAIPELDLAFRAGGEGCRKHKGDALTFSPVRCVSGKFVMDRLPWQYDSVSLRSNVREKREHVELPIVEGAPTIFDLKY